MNHDRQSFLLNYKIAIVLLFNVFLAACTGDGAARSQSFSSASATPAIFSSTLGASICDQAFALLGAGKIDDLKSFTEVNPSCVNAEILELPLLGYAWTLNQIDTVSYLVTRGGDLNAIKKTESVCRELFVAIQLGLTENISFFAKNRALCSPSAKPSIKEAGEPIFFAILADRVDSMEKLISEGYEYNVQRYFQWAIENNRARVVSVLVKRGADVNRRFTDLGGIEYPNDWPLNIALRYEAFESAQVLMREGAKLNPEVEFNSKIAEDFFLWTLAEKLVSPNYKFRPSPASQDKQEVPILLVAAEHGWARLIKALADAGANMKVTIQRYGKSVTALSLATVSREAARACVENGVPLTLGAVIDLARVRFFDVAERVFELDPTLKQGFLDDTIVNEPEVAIFLMNHGWSAKQISVENNFHIERMSVEYLEALINHGLNASTKNPDRSLLGRAISSKNFSVAKALAEHGIGLGDRLALLEAARLQSDLDGGFREIVLDPAKKMDYSNIDSDIQGHDLYIPIEIAKAISRHPLLSSADKLLIAKRVFETAESDPKLLAVAFARGAVIRGDMDLFKLAHSALKDPNLLWRAFDWEGTGWTGWLSFRDGTSWESEWALPEFGKVQQNSLSIAQTLIELGASPKFVGTDFHSRWSPLTLALNSGNMATAKFLIDAGAVEDTLETIESGKSNLATSMQVAIQFIENSHRRMKDWELKSVDNPHDIPELRLASLEVLQALVKETQAFDVKLDIASANYFKNNSAIWKPVKIIKEKLTVIEWGLKRRFAMGFMFVKDKETDLSWQTFRSIFETIEASGTDVTPFRTKATGMGACFGRNDPFGWDYEGCVL